MTIYATDANASEAGLDPGTFTVRRDGSTNFTVIVFYNLSGTASNGVDYEQLGGSVQIPAGDLAAPFTVKPIDDALVEGDETVVAEILPSPLDCATCGYTIGMSSNAVVVIADNDTGTNHPPFVRLNSPQEGDVFTAPATIRNVPSLPMNPFTRIPVFVTVALAFLLAAPPTRAVDTNSTVRPGGFQFDGKISRPVLENYLSRSICIEGMLNGRGPLTDDIRMITNCGAKYVARALCLWGAENNFLANIKRAKEEAAQVLAADSEIILEGCVFETVGPKVSQIAIPDWVFKDLGQPVEERNFRYEDIIYPMGQRRAMGNAQVPDESRLETQLWFYYQAASYIDVGCEGIHFGQVEIMNRNDHGNNNWFRLITLVRDYAAKHARRHMVLCNGHVPTGGLMHDGNPILDFHAFPLRIKETPEKPQEAILQLGFSDGIYNRSKGGKTFSGWTCEHLPYIVELDNYGRSNHPGQPNAQGGNFLWIWGYDEITWFGLQSQEYRAKWLQYAWGWVRKTDTNGYLEMPGGRTASSAEMRWYFANNPSDACPTGRGDESAIRVVWANDTAKPSKQGD